MVKRPAMALLLVCQVKSDKHKSAFRVAIFTAFNNLHSLPDTIITDTISTYTSVHAGHHIDDRNCPENLKIFGLYLNQIFVLYLNQFSQFKLFLKTMNKG